MDGNLDLETQYDKIYRYCYFKLGSRETAEDITQETFLRFLERGYGERDALPYLYTIARNLCIDEYRKKKHLSLQALGEPQGEAWGTRGCGAEETGGTGPGNAVLMENVESGLEERVVMAMAVRKALDALEEYIRDHDVDVVVSEFGVADLRGLDDGECARRIIERCAHPAHRADLGRALEEALRTGGHHPIL